jgi:hypothetical protein
MHKFTIRDLLTLTLIIGLVTGWLVDRARLTRLQKTTQELQADNWSAGIAAATAQDAASGMEQLLRSKGFQFRWRPDSLSVSGPNGEGFAMNAPNGGTLHDLEAAIGRRTVKVRVSGP